MPGFGLAGDAAQHAHAVDVHDHGDAHDRGAPEGRDDRLAAVQQPVQALVDHPEADDEQQEGLGQGREVFHLAVAIGVAAVCGAAGQAHGIEGHDGGQQVEAAVQGLGEDTQAVGVDAHAQLECGEGQRGHH